MHLGPGNAIPANRDYGILLFDLSFANFDPGNNVTGNNRNGSGTLDVACFAHYTAMRGVFVSTGVQPPIAQRTERAPAKNCRRLNERHVERTSQMHQDRLAISRFLPR